MGNFVAEILILLGTYQVSIPAAVAAAVGLVSATIYALWMVQLTFHGPDREGWKLPDLSGREAALMGVMITVILWLGLYPQPFLDTTRPVLRHLEQTATVRQMSAASHAKLSVRPDSGQDPLDQVDLRDGDRL
jgi:NADH-quinone oxidoreductase subunit M